MIRDRERRHPKRSGARRQIRRRACAAEVGVVALGMKFDVAVFGLHRALRGRRPDLRARGMVIRALASMMLCAAMRGDETIQNECSSSKCYKRSVRRAGEKRKAVTFRTRKTSDHMAAHKNRRRFESWPNVAAPPPRATFHLRRKSRSGGPSSAGSSCRSFHAACCIGSPCEFRWCSS